MDELRWSAGHTRERLSSVSITWWSLAFNRGYMANVSTLRWPTQFSRWYPLFFFFFVIFHLFKFTSLIEDRYWFHERKHEYYLCRPNHTKLRSFRVGDHGWRLPRYLRPFQCHSKSKHWRCFSHLFRYAVFFAFSSFFLPFLLLFIIFLFSYRNWWAYEPRHSLPAHRWSCM